MPLPPLGLLFLGIIVAIRRKRAAGGGIGCARTRVLSPLPDVNFKAKGRACGCWNVGTLRPEEFPTARMRMIDLRAAHFWMKCNSV